MNRTAPALVFLLLSSFFGLNTQAALISGLSGQVVYDTDRNITWLADTNYAETETFGIPFNQGASNQTRAVEWIVALNAVDSGNGYLGFNQWRLPTALVPDATCTTDAAGTNPSTDSTGYNCTGSEFGHLFYEELGGTAGVSILDSSDPDVALFVNFRENAWYWTGTEVPTRPGVFYNLGWDAATNSGRQPAFVGGGSFVGIAWPVADGNPFGIIPIPAAAWLFGSALGLLGWMRRKKV